MKTHNLIIFLFLLAFSSLFAQTENEKTGKIDRIKIVTSNIAGANTPSSTATVVTYDFTQPGAAYTTGPDPMVEVEPGVWAMIAGDANADGAIDATDQNAEWRTYNGQPWDYSIGADMNLDGSIDATDLNAFWRPNNGKSTQVPN